MYKIRFLSILDVINNINSSKAWEKDNIPLQVLKESSDICATGLSSGMNHCTYKRNLKNADVTPIFKKGDPSENEFKVVTLCRQI